MKKRIRLTESDLHRIVNESVRRVLNEGQGWNYYKNEVGRINDMSDEDWDWFNKTGGYNNPQRQRGDRDLIKYGDSGHSLRKDYFAQYYGQNGYERIPYNTQNGRENYEPEEGDKKINNGISGKLGRWAGVNAANAYGRIKNGMNKIGRAFRR